MRKLWEIFRHIQARLKIKKGKDIQARTHHTKAQPELKNREKKMDAVRRHFDLEHVLLSTIISKHDLSRSSSLCRLFQAPPASCLPVSIFLMTRVLFDMLRKQVNPLSSFSSTSRLLVCLHPPCDMCSVWRAPEAGQVGSMTCFTVVEPVRTCIHCERADICFGGHWSFPQQQSISGFSRTYWHLLPHHQQKASSTHHCGLFLPAAFGFPRYISHNTETIK